jgi:hypothetical protein
MKKTNLFISLPVLLFSLSLQAQIQQDCNGNVGIVTAVQAGYKVTQFSTRFLGDYNFYLGTYSGIIIDGSAPNARALYPSSNNTGNIGKSDKAFNEIWAYNIHNQDSDSTQKENIRPLNDALTKVLQLRGVQFDLKREFAINPAITDLQSIEKLEQERKNKVGFIAQEMVKIFPEAVHYVDSTNIYGINYTRVIPLLVEAMKEQQRMIDELKAQIEESKFKSTFSVIPSSQNPQDYNNELLQNSPNPFSEITYIGYKLNENVVNAVICIYNLNGEQIRSIPVPDRGISSVSLNGSELKAGIYLYSLITDGVVVDTKRMVLTD